MQTANRKYAPAVYDTISARWHAGISANKIGRELGLSKNTIISISRHLSLPRREPCIFYSGERKPRKPRLIATSKPIAAASKPKPERKQRSPKEIPERQLRNIGMLLELPPSQRGSLEAVNRAWKRLPADHWLKLDYNNCPGFAIVTYNKYRSGAAA